MTDSQFVPPHMLKTAVLFLVFNRLSTTKQVFEAIRKAKPPKLYIAADGPRAEQINEKDKVKAVRNYVMQNIDWECDIKTLFRDENLGCKSAVDSAITWFFNNETMGIILEDDCLPSQSFFWYCEELLKKYLNDERVFMISGSNKADKWYPENQSYHFSLGGIWGWASWSRAWKYYDTNIILWSNNDVRRKIKSLLGNKLYKLFSYGFNLVYNNQLDTWDYQWGFCRLIQSGLTIIPSLNLIKNIGFSDAGTHTAINPFEATIGVYEMEFPLKHPASVLVDMDYVDYDYFGSKKSYYRIVHHIPYSLKEIIKKIWMCR